jgi:hypothetical protein
MGMEGMERGLLPGTRTSGPWGILSPGAGRRCPARQALPYGKRGGVNGLPGNRATGFLGLPDGRLFDLYIESL